jgi:hypothetical protein
VTALLGLIVMSIRGRRRIGLALLVAAVVSLALEFVALVATISSIPS